MPSYNYKCDTCGATFSVIHSIHAACTHCTTCNATSITKVVAPFLANTETSLDAKMRHHEDQARKDLDRFYKDDKFAANITGQDDPNSAKRRAELIAKEQKKQDASRNKIKRLNTPQ